MDFDAAFDRLIGFESGYANNSADPGGETMWGITARVAIRNGYIGSMRSLPRETAKVIARKEYWDAAHCDEMPAVLRYPLFDAAYNSGPPQALKWLQRAVDVQDDGVAGPMTIAAASRADGSTFAQMLGHRLDFLTSLPTWAAFGRGWSRRLADILKGA